MKEKGLAFYSVTLAVLMMVITTKVLLLLFPFATDLREGIVEDYENGTVLINTDNKTIKLTNLTSEVPPLGARIVFICSDNQLIYWSYENVVKNNINYI